MLYKLFFCILYLSNICEPQRTTTTTSTSTLAPIELDDNMGQRDKIKIQRLATELIKDSKLRLRQVFTIITDHIRYDGFHYGILIGKISERYKTMIEVYRTAVNRLPGFNYSMVLPPGTEVVRPMHYILYMHTIYKLEKDIDEMVRLMEWVKKDAASLDKNPPPGFAPPLLRTRVEVEEEREDRGKTPGDGLATLPVRRQPYISLATVASDVAMATRCVMALTEILRELKRDERRLKSKIRQRHLMRKIGLPANTSTTNKRFIDRWPVEETWRLNEY